MKKCILIDGSGLVYRSFFAIPSTLTNPEGKPANAVLGFTNILLNIIALQKPDYLAIAFDKKGPTFRHEAYKEYKATRVKQPQELYDQFPMAKEVAETMGIPVLEADRFEADDILATLARQFTVNPGIEVLIATGDFDIFQLVNERVKILYPEKGFRESHVVGVKEIEEKYKLKPLQIPDYKGLRGDNSDNIKGVYGIGEKTAASLIGDYGSLENIYAHLEKLPEGIRKKLETGREDAFFSRQLATLVSEVPMKISLEECRVPMLDPKKIVPVFEKLGFRNLMKRLGLIHEEKGGQKISEDQVSLF